MYWDMPRVHPVFSRTMGRQWHFDADTYLASIRAELPTCDELQNRLAHATSDVAAEPILDLGSGTGVTAARVIEQHPAASLVGIDSSGDMLSFARGVLPEASFLEARLEDPLPTGPFDLAVSAFAVHHLPSWAKADLFERIAAVLTTGGRFVLCDVVVPAEPVPEPVPLEGGVDVPDTVSDQIHWLNDAGFQASAVFAEGDLAILRADHR